MSSAVFSQLGGYVHQPVCLGDHSVDGLSKRGQYHERPYFSEERWESRFRDGLPTPPQSTMTSTAAGGYSSGNTSMQGYHLPMYQPANVATGSYSINSNVSNDYLQPGKDISGQPSTTSNGFGSGYESKRNSSASIATYLQIPSTINNSQGSLSEFAADITCLFWFESGETLRQIEQSLWSSIQLSPDTTPTMGFRKWVTTILSTTQVTQNVILLALLFIYRLKKSNPGVSGKRGSEFRLFTIALMLGNKFLDDNTYTNKTWAEVSGIAVQEIHIMEVEFLSNMRYNLFVSTEEWEAWHQKLGRFYAFLQRSPQLSHSELQRPAILPSPAYSVSSNKLPSPPSPARSTNVRGYTQNYQQYQAHPLSLPPTLPPSPVKVNAAVAESRKRGWEFSPDDRQTKRPAGPAPQLSSVPYGAALPPIGPGYAVNAASQDTSSYLPSTNANRGLRLPVPRLQTSTPSSMNEIHGIQLPLPSGRAISTVYPPNLPVWTQPIGPISSTAPSAVNLHSTPIPPLSAGQQSQYSAASARSSPTGPSTYSAITPTTHLSPSYFLTNRNSPYRPVRHVHTLLNPPPSTSLQDPTRSISFEQMRYQPLSKLPTEQKAGVVPYLHGGPWTQAALPPPTNSAYLLH